MLFIYSILNTNFPGAAAGPVIGGYIAQNMGFKYVFIVTSISCGVAALVGIPFLRETYAPVIRLNMAKRTSDSEKGMAAQKITPIDESIWHILWLNLSRPIILLTRSFICFILSLYLAL